MKRLILIMLIIALPGVAFSDPHLVSDPQCKSKGHDDNCASGFVISVDGGQSWAAAGSQDVGTDDIRVYHDLDGIAKGQHDYQVKAVNAWGESAPVPFLFTKGVPSPPTGFGIE